jgi:O-antigen/teichoic acid export membrane protein
MIIKASLMLIITTGLAGILNYLFHLLGLKFLTPLDFGLLESFTALNYFLAVLVGAFSLSAIRFHQAFPRLKRLSWRLSLVSFGLFILAYPIFKLLLHLDNPLIYLIFGCQFLWLFPATLYSAVFQVKLKFKAYSLISLLSPVLKLLLAGLFLLLNFKVFGAVAALTLTGLIVFLITLVYIQFCFPANAAQQQSSRGLPQFFTTAFFTQLGLTSLYSADLILTRFFLPQSSGAYAAASLFAKIIFFASAPVTTVAYPLFSRGLNLKKNFFSAFLLILIISGIGAAGLSLSSERLRLFPLVMLLLSLFNLCCQFLLANDKRNAAVWPLSAALLQFILIIINHANPAKIILNSLTAVSLGLIFSLYSVITSLNETKS